jgi:fatty acid desaturase
MTGILVSGNAHDINTQLTVPVSPSRSDYQLIGGAGEHACAIGLVGATWYKCAVPRPALKELMRRSDRAAIRDTVLWYALILSAGVLAYLSRGTGWAVPAFLLYGTLYAGPADSRWHEAGHGTAFRTRWMNDLLYQLASFQEMRRPTVWRWSHARHHTDTLVTGRDPEIQVQLPVNLLSVLIDMCGLKLGPSEMRKMVINAAGRMIEEEKTFIPETEWRKVVNESRAWVAIYATVIGISLYSMSWLPLLFIGLPSLYGGWLYNFFGVTQHAGLPENVLDHRLNSRTVKMNPVFRFLYWNMNYHVEHHMFPMVPYHALPRLHEAIKADCPDPYPSVWAAYKEVVPAILRQRRDPTYHIRRVLPTGSRGTTPSPGGA